MANTVLDEKTLQNMPAAERAQLQKTLASSGRSGSGQAQKKKKKSNGSGKLLALLLYGAACGVGGAYVDRHFVPQARIWLGQQAQTLADMGSEQKIRGLIDKADLAPSEKSRALANIQAVYVARTQGTLTSDQVETLLRAEAPFQAATARGTAVPAKEMSRSLELFADLASDL